MKVSRTKLEAVATVLLLGATALMASTMIHPALPHAFAPGHGASASLHSGPPSAPPFSLPAASIATSLPATSLPAPPLPEGSRVGPSFDDDRSLPAHATPVADYTLRADLDTIRHTVAGTGTILWRNRSKRAIHELYFHLYANAFESDRSVFLSDRRLGGRGTRPIRDHGGIEIESLSIRGQGGVNLWLGARPANERAPDDRTDMRVPLDVPIEAGSEALIDIRWRTKLPSIVERMGYHGSFHMVAQWFPKIAKLEADGTFAHFSFDRLAEFYADFGTYDVTLTVPKGFKVGATGQRVSAHDEGQRRVLRYVQSDIHDFAFSAYDDFRELHRDADGVDIRIFFPPGHLAAAREQLRVVAFGLRSYGASYGVYPYPTLTIVYPPEDAAEAGGMEYPTLITTGGHWWGYGNSGLARALTLHELGHQFFYGLVATDEHRWPFLDEGLTTFIEEDALEQGWGNEGAGYVDGWGLRASTVLRHSGIDGGHDDVIAKPAPDFASGASYARLVYARTALVLETMNRVYDGGMRRALGRYARRYRFTHPGPEHLLGAVCDTLGGPAEQALRTCLFDRGWIDVAVQDLRCASNTCTLVVTRRGNVQLPVQVAWIHSDGTVSSSKWAGREQQGSLTLETSKPVVGAVLDPDHEILIDEDFSNNAIGLDGLRSAWRTRGVLTFAAALGLSGVCP